MYGRYVDEPVAMIHESGPLAGQMFYYIQHRQYHISALVNASGVVVERYHYSAFGQMAIDDGAGNVRATSAYANPFGYTGRVWQAEAGLWQYRARWYSPTLGRFLQRDPAGYVDGMNVYAYVANNPGQSPYPSEMMRAIHWDVLRDPVVSRRWRPEGGC